jgi:hypothetical protein
VLSIHFDGGRCRVACPFCYLGQREGEPRTGLPLDLIGDALRRLSYREVAVALSEPVDEVLPALPRLAQAAAGRLFSVTTTVAVATALPADVLELIGRLNLSVDPFKGPVEAARVAGAVAEVRRRTRAEIVLIVTLNTRRFARTLFAGGLLKELIAIPAVDKVALNAVKPPPGWCDRRFWLGALAQIGPLLREHLDRRLFLDCYVAARILHIGGCPARPDLSPDSQDGRVAFRGCVYQPAPDFTVESGAELAERLVPFEAPAACPFPIE